MEQRRVLRELPRVSRTAQRETEGRNARTVTELAVIIHPSFIVDAPFAPSRSSIRLWDGQVVHHGPLGLVER